MYLLKIITIFLPTVAFGFSYQDAYQMLLTTNPTYTIATVDYEISTLAYHNAKAAQLPRLDLRGGAERFIQENATSGYRAFIGPRLSLPIYQGGQLRAEKRLGSQQMDANELSIQIRLLEQTQQLQEMYARALYSKNYLAVAKNIYERSQKNLRLVEIKYRSGHEYRWVFLTTKKTLEEDKLRVLEAELNQQNALVDLENMIGKIPVENINDLDETSFYPQELTEEEINQVDLSQHPEYLLSSNQVTQSGYKVNISEASQYPDINFRADFIMIDTDDEPVIPFWSTGVTFSMPLFAFGRVKRSVKVAKKQNEQEKLKNVQKLRDLQASLQKSKNSYLIATKKLYIAQLELEAAQDRFRVTTEKYQNGLIDFLDWDRAQAILKSAENELLIQKRDCVIAYSKIVKSMGGLHD